MRRDLALAVALACLALLAALATPALAVRAVLLVPLVLVLPGYAIAALLFPPGSISPAERGVYTVCLSISIAAVGGLLIQLVAGLDRDIWAFFLATVTIVAGLRGLSAGARRPMPSLHSMPRSLPVAIAVFLVAGLIAGLAIASAGRGLRHAQSKIHFTDFWLLPARTANSPGSDIVSVGLHSHEGMPTRYALRLQREGVPLASERVSLRAGEEWERLVRVVNTRASAPVVATLSRNGRPYRHLDLTLPR